MMLIHGEYSEKELEIIRRGRQNNLNNAEEKEFYLKYYKKYRNEFIREFIEDFKKDNVIFDQILECGLFTVGFSSGMIFLAARSYILTGLFFAIMTSGMFMPSVIHFVKAYKKYCKEVKKQETSIAEEYEKREQELLEQEKENVKDDFVDRIDKDINEVLTVGYESFQKDISALYSLKCKYLEAKIKLKTDDSAIVHSNFPNFNKILLAIESSINEKSKSKENQELETKKLVETPEAFSLESIPIMSEEELLTLISEPTGFPRCKKRNQRHYFNK